MPNGCRHVVLALTACILGLGASVANAQIWSGEDPLDPRTCVSPSGEYALFIDPSHPLGAWAGSYRLTRNGVEQWQGTRPWTLWDAEVTDDGLVAGYAYLAGRNGFLPDGEKQDGLIAVVLDARGKSLLEHRSPREGQAGCAGPHAEPMVRGFFLDRAGERLVLRMLSIPEGGEGEPWWTYSLASGQRGPDQHPRTKMLQDSGLSPWILEARAIPGTDLVLTCWGWAWNEPREELRGWVFTLLAPDGEVRWRLDWPGVGPRAEGSAILGASLPRRFALHDVAAGERVTFEVEPDTGPRAGIRVFEVERSPEEATRPEAAVPPEQPIVPTLALRPLGAIVLGDTSGDEPCLEPLGPIANLVVGSGDQLYAADGHTAIVHVFDSSGKSLRRYRPAPQDFPNGLREPSLTVTDAGEVFVLNGSLHSRVCVRFDPSGRPTRVEGSRSWYAQPRTGRLWLAGFRSVRLVTPDGSLLRTIERGADDTWLRRVDRAAVAPDGSLALASEWGRTNRVVHLYTPDGDPVRMLALPEGYAAWQPFAFDGERLAFGVENSDDSAGSVVLLDVQGECLGRFTPARPVRFWTPYFAAGGTELWLFDGERRVERYRLD